jgi:hypothetical protein
VTPKEGRVVCVARGSQPKSCGNSTCRAASLLRILTISLRLSLVTSYPSNLGALFGAGRGFRNSDLLFQRSAPDGNPDNISVERIITLLLLA